MTINPPPVYYIQFIFSCHDKHHRHRSYYGRSRAGWVGWSGMGGEERDKWGREGWLG